VFLPPLLLPSNGKLEAARNVCGYPHKQGKINIFYQTSEKVLPDQL
jgi:hypothetical protein